MTSQDSDKLSFRDALSSALRYWEPKRLIFNGALVLVVAGAFVAALPDSQRALDAQMLLLLFILAVLANIAYCAAYVPDLALQFSSFRETWLRSRWLLLTLGTLFASAITYFWAAALFGVGAGAL